MEALIVIMVITGFVLFIGGSLVGIVGSSPKSSLLRAGVEKQVNRVRAGVSVGVSGLGLVLAAFVLSLVFGLVG